MFPTLVWKIQLKSELHEAIDAKILAALARTRRDAPGLASGQGWQSDHTLHELEEFRDLVSCINVLFVHGETQQAALVSTEPLTRVGDPGLLETGRDWAKA